MSSQRPDFSLLWLDKSQPPAPQPETSRDDLRLASIADAIAPHRHYRRPIYNLLATPLTDLDILRYRGDALDDCLALPGFAAGLLDLLPLIRSLSETARDIRARRHELPLALTRLTELENYVDCAAALDDLLRAHRERLDSRAWLALADESQRRVQDPLFQQLRAELPELRDRVREIVSVTVGVNLSPDLRPVAATLLSVNKTRFKGPRFLPRFFGGGDDETRGITPLRERPPGAGSVVNRRETLDRLEGSALFSDLAKALDDIIRPINRALSVYTGVSSRPLRAIEAEIAFYAGACQLIGELRAAGLPTCRPQLLPIGERRANVSGLYNLDLALRTRRQNRAADLSNEIVLNDVDFDADGRILILTGPNRGGKTTWMSAVGMLHVLAQAGLHVPAKSAALSPVDAVYLHFPAEEDPTQESGRLGEEAARLRQIFRDASAHSLVLLNESLASTSAAESYALARDVLSCLRMLGARAVFVTHLHELAADCAEINAAVPGDSQLRSFVSAVESDADTPRRTFRVRPGPPQGKSYAREIARQYGISFDQLRQLINDDTA